MDFVDMNTLGAHQEAMLSLGNVDSHGTGGALDLSVFFLNKLDSPADALAVSLNGNGCVFGVVVLILILSGVV